MPACNIPVLGWRSQAAYLPQAETASALPGTLHGERDHATATCCSLARCLLQDPAPPHFHRLPDPGDAGQRLSYHAAERGTRRTNAQSCCKVSLDWRSGKNALAARAGGSAIDGREVRGGSPSLEGSRWGRSRCTAPFVLHVSGGLRYPGHVGLEGSGRGRFLPQKKSLALRGVGQGGRSAWRGGAGRSGCARGREASAGHGAVRQAGMPGAGLRRGRRWRLDPPRWRRWRRRRLSLPGGRCSMLGRVRTAVAHLVGGQPPAPAPEPAAPEPAAPGPAPAEGFSRPAFLQLSPEELQRADDHAGRAVQSPRGTRRRLPWSTGYAE